MYWQLPHLPDFGDPQLWDETVRQLDEAKVKPGDVVGIGIHTGNALRGYAVGRLVKQRGAFVILGEFTPLCTPMKRLNTVRPIVWFAVTETWRGVRSFRITEMVLPAVSMRVAAWKQIVSSPSAGSW